MMREKMLRVHTVLLLLLIVSMQALTLPSLKFNRLTSVSYKLTLSSSSLPSSLSPVSSLDYYQLSNRTEKLSFVEASNATAANTINAALISSTEYQSWYKQLSNSTHELLESTGLLTSKFPGSKLITVPLIVDTATAAAADQSINSITYKTIGFYDHKVVTSSFSRGFEGIFSSFKGNKTYCFSSINGTAIDVAIASKLALSWSIASYKFSSLGFKSKSSTAESTHMIYPDNCDRESVFRMSRAYTLYRDLVDSPALACGPAELQDAAYKMAADVGANSISSIVGLEQLLQKNYPQIAAVGMAAAPGREPRIVDMQWTHKSAANATTMATEESGTNSSNSNELPYIVIIGKGVTFDTGGLNIKGAGMRNMKKDMAGCAQALSLAYLIMDANLPVALRVLLPICENSIASNSIRPGDVIKSRNGLTIEITNTDAEGRLILSDAIAAAVEEGDDNSHRRPNLLIDFATLTGAARVALGNDLPALFSNNITASTALWQMSSKIDDPVWPMPLYEPLRDSLKSPVADLVNAADAGGGAITAALFLSEFIKKPTSSSSSSSSSGSSSSSSGGTETIDEDATSTDSDSSASDAQKLQDTHDMIWFHFDFMGSKNGNAVPQGMRSIYNYIVQQYVEKKQQ